MIYKINYCFEKNGKTALKLILVTLDFKSVIKLYNYIKKCFLNIQHQKKKFYYLCF